MARPALAPGHWKPGLGSLSSITRPRNELKYAFCDEPQAWSTAIPHIADHWLTIVRFNTEAVLKLRAVATASL